MFARWAVRPPAGADQHVDQRGPRDAIRVAAADRGLTALRDRRGVCAQRRVNGIFNTGLRENTFAMDDGLLMSALDGVWSASRYSQKIVSR